MLLIVVIGKPFVNDGTSCLTSGFCVTVAAGFEISMYLAEGFPSCTNSVTVVVKNSSKSSSKTPS